MQGNILEKANERSANLNIFTQVKEPTKKDGIWIKTKETKKINVIFYYTNCINNNNYYYNNY